MIDDRTHPNWRPKGPGIDWAERSLRLRREAEKPPGNPATETFWAAIGLAVIFAGIVVASVAVAL